MSKTIIVLNLLLTVSTSVYGQIIKKNRDNLDSLKIAEAYVQDENFDNAIGFYKRFIMMNPDDPELNFKLGFCLLNTPTGKEESIIYFTKAAKRYKKKKGRRSLKYIESYFYLARAYRSIYKFDKALEIFYFLRKKIKNKKFRTEVDLEIKLCQTGKELISKKIEITIENPGEFINSKFSDHSPVISADESVLIFTSRRKNNSGGEPDMDGKYDEDIFICRRDNDKWGVPEGISSKINTADHEASISVSADGQTLFIYRGEDNGSIYMSKLSGTEWTKPVKLGKNINTSFRETHASLSPDGKHLFFTSDRKGGFGELDIYVSKKQKNGKWGKAENMGDKINTEKNEEGPYIHLNGKTLYFSSEGHKSLGGYDIFRSKKNRLGTWTTAENIGYPVNTVNDDVYFFPTPDGKRAYYSSDKKGGKGGNDIYIITLTNEEETDIVVVSGTVSPACAKDLINVDIAVVEKETNAKIYYKPNSSSGKFVFVITKNKEYELDVELDKKNVFNEKFEINDNDSHNKYKTIEIPAGINCKSKGGTIDSTNFKNIDDDGVVYSSNIEIENILFEFDQNKYNMNKNVDLLILYIKNNPEAVVEIGAYADSRGNAFYNHFLAMRRGNSIKKYMLRKGIKSKNIKVVGYGEENPIAYNKINGEYNQRGMKYNRRAEFRILKQGKDTLLIRPINNIPKELKNPNYNKKYVKNNKNNKESNF